MGTERRGEKEEEQQEQEEKEEEEQQDFCIQGYPFGDQRQRCSHVSCHGPSAAGASIFRAQQKCTHTHTHTRTHTHTHTHVAGRVHGIALMEFADLVAC